MNNNLHPVMAAALAPFLAGMTKPTAKRFSSDFDSTVSGIPCGIRIDTVEIHKGNYSWNAACPEEYNGYSDIEFTVLDRSGYEAPWLQAKLTDDDTARIESEIIESLKEEE